MCNPLYKMQLTSTAFAREEGGFSEHENRKVQKQASSSWSLSTGIPRAAYQVDIQAQKGGGDCYIACYIA